MSEKEIHLYPHTASHTITFEMWA